jgi:hypothetical protein
VVTTCGVHVHVAQIGAPDRAVMIAEEDALALGRARKAIHAEMAHPLLDLDAVGVSVL